MSSSSRTSHRSSMLKWSPSFPQANSDSRLIPMDVEGQVKLSAIRMLTSASMSQGLSSLLLGTSGSDPWRVELADKAMAALMHTQQIDLHVFHNP